MGYKLRGRDAILWLPAATREDALPLGLPNHLAPVNISRAFSHAARAIASVSLVAALLATAAIQIDEPQRLLWPGDIALVIFIAAVFVFSRHRTAAGAVAYLLIGGACMYWYAITGAFELGITGRTDSFLLTLPKIALIMVGAGSSALSVSLWAVAGFLVGEGVTALAALQSGITLALDGTSLIVLLVSFGLMAIISANRRSATRAQSNVTRAARDEQVSELRFGIEAKAAAVMHDTVLGHLAALSVSEPGPISSDLRAQVARDLQVLLGEEWLLDASSESGDQASSHWRSTALFGAIADARDLGLAVEVSGDVAVLEAVGAEKATAIAQATKQCLVNVLRHSGTENAEVVVYSSDREVSVMVVDAGRGFSEAETGADRLGLRQSVRRRIEAVGGDVQVWSTPGRGTSVMIRVPIDPATDPGIDGGAPGIRHPDATVAP